jgi:hypothetical protein
MRTISVFALAAALAIGATPASAVVVEWTVASGGNGHFYEYVATPLTASQANAAAPLSTYNGLTGYLVTVTSADEEAFLTNSVSGAAGWAGGSDAEVEGTWKWTQGPEAGTVFWKDGVTLTYANWSPNEPNDNQGREDFLLIKHIPVWNDGQDVIDPRPYYVEYSAAPVGPGVPEPATWAMMLTGLFGLGAVLRRRRAAVA